MKAAFFALVCSVGLRSADCSAQPSESLSEFLLAQHPTGARSRQSNTGITARRTAVPSMALDKKTLPGVSAPFGYWDPAGLLKDADDNKINYFRELEIKNGRVAMLAALGYAVAEKYHPFYTGEEKGAISGLASFGGDGYDARFDVGFTRALTAVDQLNAKYVIAITLILAVFETGAFYGRFFGGDYEEDRQPGDIGFDPLNLKPKDPQQLKRIQTQEINNGRLAMLAITGMIGQEFNTDYQPLDINIFAPN